MITLSTSPRPSDYHHGDLRAALIAAALAILEEGGSPAALSLRAASRRAGVSAMAPYRHFADKEALLAAVAMVGFSRLEAALREADGASPPSEALIRQGVAYVAFACADPALFRLMFGTIFAEGHRDLMAARAASFAVMTQRVHAIVGPKEGDGWALRCWATAHGLASLAVDGQLVPHAGDPAKIADRILRLGAMPS